MIDQRAQIIYVGKAKSLKKRVSSYFRAPAQLSPKTRTMMTHVAELQVTVTHTETEALLLESNLIKEFRPRYNIVLRDDKSYPYIYLSTDREFPSLDFHRGARNAKGRYFGPYPSAAAVRQTLSLLQKLFLVRQCSESFFKNRSRPCLQHQIKRCSGPCVGLVEAPSYALDVRHTVMFLEGKSQDVVGELATRMETAAETLDYETAARFRDQIKSLQRVLERQYVGGAKGNTDVIAAMSRDGVGVVQLFSIRDGQNLGNRTFFPRNTNDASPEEILSAFIAQYYLSGPTDRVVPPSILLNTNIKHVGTLEAALTDRAGRHVAISAKPRGHRARWLDLATANAEIALRQRLSSKATVSYQLRELQNSLGLTEIPSRIECFDVSHTQGEAPVASCVVFGSEGPIKSDYRRFNITEVIPGDDYAAMEQALARRYARVQKEDGKLPDLVLIDGGKGQLRKAEAVLQHLGMTEVTVVGIAKGASRKAGLEKIVLSQTAIPLILSEDSLALHLLQRVRDEAHRFAITGHRNRRKRARNTSRLEQIPGIGAVLRQRLLKQFGGLHGVQRAGVEDLSRVRGVSRVLAQSIYEQFRGD